MNNETQTYVFFGQVGSGKGTQAKLLMDYLKKKDGKEQVYVYPGSEFRKLIESQNYTGKLVKNSLEQGALQPDFLTTAIFTNVLINNLTEDKHLFADGYPRNILQSDEFEQMTKFYQRKNVKIIFIEISKEEAMRRNLQRGRSDDVKEVIQNRFEEYLNNTIPAMNHLKEKEGYEFYSIYGEQSVEEVHNEIIKTLGL